jgi:hypothetical protein
MIGKSSQWMVMPYSMNEDESIISVRHENICIYFPVNIANWI